MLVLIQSMVMIDKPGVGYVVAILVLIYRHLGRRRPSKGATMRIIVGYPVVEYRYDEVSS
jgi:hypothetical protein